MKNVIVIPVLNEEKHILEVLEKTEKSVETKDIIYVVDNDSTDNSVALIKEKFPEVKIIQEKKRGKGNAIRLGFEAALLHKPEFVTMIDGDGEKDPEDIPVLVKTAKASGADMIIGRRVASRSLRREILKRFENFWLRYATGFDVKDGSSGFNVILAESLKKMTLVSEEFEIEPEIILECRKNSMTVLEHPIKTPLFSPTKVSLTHILEINGFFDRWVLDWIGNRDCDLPIMKKISLKIFCSLGLLIFGSNKNQK
jgi:glycosyltransferase involved in cell wall biosynthesis